MGRRVVEYAAAASVAGALAVLFLWNGVLGRLEATVLLASYVAGVVWVWRREQEPPLLGELAELAEEAGEAEAEEPSGPCSSCCSACSAWWPAASSRSAARRVSWTRSA